MVQVDHRKGEGDNFPDKWPGGWKERGQKFCVAPVWVGWGEMGLEQALEGSPLQACPRQSPVSTAGTAALEASCPGQSQCQASAGRAGRLQSRLCGCWWAAPGGSLHSLGRPPPHSEGQPPTPWGLSLAHRALGHWGLWGGVSGWSRNEGRERSPQVWLL